jgi:hypothetical protein
VSVGLVVLDGVVVECAPYARRWAYGRAARDVWREQAAAGADLVWMELERGAVTCIGRSESQHR